MAPFFLRRYSPAFIGPHLLDFSSLQQDGRGSTTVAASGKPKKAILYLSGISSESSISSPVSFLTGRGGSDTRCTVFFHRPLVHRINKYPTLIKIAPGFGSTWMKCPVFSTATVAVLSVELMSAISRPPTFCWKRSVRVPKSECAGHRTTSLDRRSRADTAG